MLRQLARMEQRFLGSHTAHPGRDGGPINMNHTLKEARMQSVFP